MLHFRYAHASHAIDYYAGHMITIISRHGNGVMRYTRAYSRRLVAFDAFSEGACRYSAKFQYWAPASRQGARPARCILHDALRTVGLLRAELLAPAFRSCARYFRQMANRHVARTLMTAIRPAVT